VFGAGFSGTVFLEFHDLRDNALLLANESPAYCIGPKGTEPKREDSVKCTDVRLQ
jgi:hypothetical protein